MSIEAARNALARAQIDPQDSRAVWVGSESHPYAVKPTSTVVAEAIGAAHLHSGRGPGVRLQGGQRGHRGGHGRCRLRMGRYALAIGMDTAQGRPGGRAGIYGCIRWRCIHHRRGRGERGCLRRRRCRTSADTPDFWRRAYAHYPSHGHRFTGEPAYFEHVVSAGKELLAGDGHAAVRLPLRRVLHQPNTKFPQRAAQMLGFTPEQIKAGPARARHRQHVCRVVSYRPDCRFGRGGARRPHIDGVLWFRRRLRCVFDAGDRAHQRSARPCPQDAGLHRATEGDRLRDLRALTAISCK
jgi:hydroxymethylglutaryl-CoA synthase